MDRKELRFYEMTDKEIDEITKNLPMTKHGVSRRSLDELVERMEYDSEMDVKTELRKLYYKYKNGIPKEELQ